MEERLAELEAAAARSGRNGSVQLYGRVSEALIWWNDGKERNAFVQENYNVKNVIGARGNAKIDGHLSAGFRLELGIRAYRSSNANQTSLGDTNSLTVTSYETQSVALRFASWHLESQRYGRVTVGVTSADSTRSAATINLADVGGFAQSGNSVGYINGGFYLRRKGVRGNEGLSALSWGGVSQFQASAAGGAQLEYATPFFLGWTNHSGFRTEVTWGQDDFWGTKLFYSEAFQSFRVAAGLGYVNWRGVDRGQCANPSSIPAAASGGVSNTSCHGFQAGGSIMHADTGFYVSSGWARILDDRRRQAADLASTSLAAGATRTLSIGKDDTLWWAQTGWEAKVNTLGKSTIWTMYTAYRMGLSVRGNAVQTMAATDVLNPLGTAAFIASANTGVWGVGLSQAIDAATMQVYVGYLNFATDLRLIDQSATAPVQRARANPIDNFSTLYSGATIRF